MPWREMPSDSLFQELLDMMDIRYERLDPSESDPSPSEFCPECECPPFRPHNGDCSLA